jgi:hypothetical protein
MLYFCGCFFLEVVPGGPPPLQRALAESIRRKERAGLAEDVPLVPADVPRSGRAARHHFGEHYRQHSQKRKDRTSGGCSPFSCGCSQERAGRPPPLQRALQKVLAESIRRKERKDKTRGGSPLFSASVPRSGRAARHHFKSTTDTTTDHRYRHHCGEERAGRPRGGEGGGGCTPIDSEVQTAYVAGNRSDASRRKAQEFLPHLCSRTSRH